MRKLPAANGIFFKYLIPYVSILLVPLLLMGVFLFTYIRKAMEQQIIESDLRVLAQARSIVDVKLRDMSNAFVSLLNADQLPLPSAPGDTYAYYRTSDRLRTFLESNGIFMEVLWYLTDQDTVLGASGVYTNASASQLALPSTRIALSDFCADARGEWEPFVRSYGRSIVFYYPSEGYQYYPAQVVAFVMETSAFMGLARQPNSAAQTYLFNARDELVASSADAHLPSERLLEVLPHMGRSGHTTLREERSEYLVTYLTSDVSGWTYVNVSDRALVLRTLFAMEAACALLLLTAALSGLILIRMAMRTTYTPVARLRSSIEAHGGQGVVSMDMMIKRVEDVYLSNRHLRRSIMEYQTLAQAQVFRGLLSGQIGDMDELHRLLLQTGVPSRPSAYRVLLTGVHFRGEPTEEREAALSGVRDMLARDMLQNGALLSDQHILGDLGVLAMLLDGAAYPLEALEDGAAVVTGTVRQLLGVSLSLCLTFECRDIEVIRQGYFAARAALPANGAGSLTLVQPALNSPADVVKENRALVRRFEEALDAGERAEALETLESALRALPGQDTLPGYARYLGYDISSALLRAMGRGLPAPDGAAEEALTRAAEEGDLALIAQIARAVISQGARSAREAAVDPIIAQIKKSVEQGLSEASFDIQVIATQLGYSYKYISHHFRKVTGYRLSDYITRARIERFKQALRTRNEPISALIHTVGYDSAVTFTRVFKQYEGITPGQYREKMRKQTGGSPDEQDA